MSNLLAFQFESNDVRVITDENGEHWFVLRDVLAAMNTSVKTNEAQASILGGLGDGNVKTVPIQTPGGIQQIVIINEPSVTFLITRSNTETGKRLNRWIHAEVLPSIRKTGLFNSLPIQALSESGDSIVFFERDDYWTLSTVIAKIFDKNHQHVLRDIDFALQDVSKFGLISNFIAVETSYLDSHKRSNRCLKINRALFNYVVLSYQGEKAKLYRAKYIMAFEELEKSIKVLLTQQMIYKNPSRQQVYIIRNPINNLIKIGVTNNISRRLAELQNASGCELSVDYLAPKSDNAQNIEQRLHKMFSDRRHIGEWFDIETDTVINELKAAGFTINTVI